MKLYLLTNADSDFCVYQPAASSLAAERSCVDFTRGSLWDSVKVVAVSDELRLWTFDTFHFPGFSPKLPLSEKAQRKWFKYILRPKFSWTLV